MLRTLALFALGITLALGAAGCCADPCDPLCPGDPCRAETPPCDPCAHPCRKPWVPLRANRCCVWQPVPDPCAPAWDLPDPCAPGTPPRTP